jgi:hypothetical protein
MAVFIRPSRVIVEESGGGLAVVVLAGAALAMGALAAVVDDIIVTLAVAAVIAVIGSLAVLAWVLRRGRGTVSTAAPQLPVRARGVITAPARPAIEPRRVLPGVVISEHGAAGGPHSGSAGRNHRGRTAPVIRRPPRDVPAQLWREPAMPIAESQPRSGDR